MVILGHRGASAVAPENTLVAFRRALELGADGFEFDVTLTRDRVPIIIHDDTLDRTTTGKGNVKDFTLEELERLDAGGWKGAEYRGEKMPTLAEVIDLVAPLRPRPILNIELKASSLMSDGVEMATLDVLFEKKYFDNIIISSFNPMTLMRMRLIAPRIPRGLLYASDQPVHLRRAWLRPLIKPAAMHPYYRMIDERMMSWAKRKNLQVNTWTVDEPEVADKLRGWGVNAIITNDVEKLLEAQRQGKP
jgi:glycerophosphoryl diester phosphodiesterase